MVNVELYNTNSEPLVELIEKWKIFFRNTSRPAYELKTQIFCDIHFLQILFFFLYKEDYFGVVISYDV